MSTFRGTTRPSPEPQTRIARNLEHVRELRGIRSHREFWQRLMERRGPDDDFEVSYTAVRNYHTDREPPVSYLVRVSEVFGVDLHWLATGEGAPTRVQRNARESALELAKKSQHELFPGDKVDPRSADASEGARPTNWDDEILAAAESTFPPLGKVAYNRMAIWAPWLQLRQAYIRDHPFRYDDGGLDEAFDAWREETSRAEISIAQGIGRVLSAPFDILGIDVESLRSWQVEAYVAAACTALSVIVPNPDPLSQPFGKPLRHLGAASADLYRDDDEDLPF